MMRPAVPVVAMLRCELCMAVPALPHVLWKLARGSGVLDEKPFAVRSTHGMSVPLSCRWKTVSEVSRARRSRMCEDAFIEKPRRALMRGCLPQQAATSEERKASQWCNP